MALFLYVLEHHHRHNEKPLTNNGDSTFHMKIPFLSVPMQLLVCKQDRDKPDPCCFCCPWTCHRTLLSLREMSVRVSTERTSSPLSPTRPGPPAPDPPPPRTAALLENKNCGGGSGYHGTDRCARRVLRCSGGSSVDAWPIAIIITLPPLRSLIPPE